jgi:putative intracellular protease/amidase
VAGWTGLTAAKAEVVLLVCTGALRLAIAGRFDGLVTTMYHGATDLQRQVSPTTTFSEGVRWFDNGKLITLAGTGPTFHVLGTPLGHDQANETVWNTENRWPGMARYPNETL